ncbi:pyrroloquinoline quinone biosynthesis protein PqqB [Methyloversatilis sp.]|uniref:pyrroloquinoline quinone biosynthesis protein PqqB n=1 Tax=Methyloversatilis sp. TaxID=2569862 RepID=UPI002733FBD9|nr:pyrroloquinoline quinone biosynthesis protein PqqB [Methyloversatilis sp.]MDP2867238.1 pyrroloquinoline quinone biosynthesis protein PqqB [Methyloversatilis sp.]MDP3288798.1 pyrroloquinoline quinone biosynthesis protein PqqB [Methyloversatilis sp.]MDP3457065.1 pyrroloquinoline quinone biosynthesis protein PqqB [Methyloversatilis sp.]MDP3578885.1 pyrroloquinoline quinone biosynthesis protein PqqB [Methyloversatilis sp.]
MRLHVLGSGAGGGFPQWNCNCHNCDGLRKGTIRATARTQSSITVTGDNENWVLFNASPDILTQFQQFPELQPARALRDTAVKAIVLIDGQIDHTTGLYMLREHRQPHEIWCTPPVQEDLTQGNPLFRLLGHYCGVNWNALPIDESMFEMKHVPDLRFHAHHLRSNAPPYSPRRDKPVPGDNIGVTIEDTKTGRKIYYAPGLVDIEPHVWAAMQAADVVLVDGTFWTDDEMIALGASKKYARDMGHLPQTGESGMMVWLDKLPKTTRKILIHINNTNPILNEDSAQRRELESRGIEVAYDGMDITV